MIMILKYGSFSKKVCKDYMDDSYLLSIEICCPMMSFFFNNSDMFELTTGALSFCDDNWPLMLNSNHFKLAAQIPIYHCPHCGKPILVYVDDKLYKTRTQIEEGLS